MLLPFGLKLAHPRGRIAHFRLEADFLHQRFGTDDQLLARRLGDATGLLQRRLDALDAAAQPLLQRAARRGRHGVLERAELAPRELEAVQRAQLLFPVCGQVVGVRGCRLHRRDLEGGEQRLAGRQIVLACGFQSGLLRGHRLVRRPHRRIETLPQRLAGDSAQAVEFFPAGSQRMDGITVRLEVQLGGIVGIGIGAGQREPGQVLRLGHQAVAGASAAPFLPALQARQFGLQDLVASTQRVVRHDAIDRFQGGIDGLQMLLHFPQSTLGECGFGLLHQRVQPKQLFGAGDLGHGRRGA